MKFFIRINKIILVFFFIFDRIFALNKIRSISVFPFFHFSIPTGPAMHAMQLEINPNHSRIFNNTIYQYAWLAIAVCSKHLCKIDRPRYTWINASPPSPAVDRYAENCFSCNKKPLNAPETSPRIEFPKYRCTRCYPNLKPKLSRGIDGRNFK